MAVFTDATFLLPEPEWIEKWPVIACDQFTSERSYWDEVEREVGDAPSTLRLTYPEIYLSEDREARIARINQAMRDVLARNVLRPVTGFVYIERELLNGQVRRGLLGVIDLDAYSYMPDADTPVRATERTVPERIPPRVQIRENAPLELSHVLLFADDPQDLILHPLEEMRESFPLLYDMDLMMGGGRIRGYLVSGDAATETRKRIADYEALRAEGKDKPVLYLVGDGNHSLATAKTCYEQRKGTEGTHTPARYATVELGNIQDEALQFEPIHRLIKGVDPAAFTGRLREMIGSDEGKAVRVICGGHAEVMHLNPALGVLPVATVQKALDDMLGETPEKIDYIHGEESLLSLAAEDQCVGIQLPPVSKKAFFSAIEKDGVLPRKTFSIGHAQEKRYYMEARKIR